MLFFYYFSVFVSWTCFLETFTQCFLKAITVKSRFSWMWVSEIVLFPAALPWQCSRSLGRWVCLKFNSRNPDGNHWNVLSADTLNWFSSHAMLQEIPTHMQHRWIVNRPSTFCFSHNYNYLSQPSYSYWLTYTETFHLLFRFGWSR